MRRLFAAFSFCILLFSCEKNINFNLNRAPDVLVVDAIIENGIAPRVILTNSFSFFSNINATILLNSFVHNAVVTMSNGTLTHQLKEYHYQIGNSVNSSINVYYYGIDSSDMTTAFKGAFNTSYTLNITSNGKNYSAFTTIPPLAKKIDNLSWKPAPFTTDTSDIILSLTTTDPPGLGNYIRYFTRTNSKPFLPGENSVYDDEIIDGTTYSFQLPPGVDRNKRVPFDSSYFKRGDTITVKFCNIDKGTYTFWNTWEFAFQSIGNPFAQPNKVLGNISNGALGDFYGYAADYKTIIIPKH